ncbi:4-hydroxy-tetrahydrodipicolinate synthase [Halocella sp. SP3-1]|uniref:4-hydroxy-tetrahydrodipicolinate synthase n=1 Tax=Halocella sp. SP3-1 TaxID=2382161 RepID=UPI00336A9FAC
MMKHFGDVLTAMVTPFTEELTVDYDMVRKLARYLINNGSDGLVVLGTTGEVPTLSFEEKVEILKTVVDEIGDSSTIVAGTGSYSTSDSIRLTQKAEEIGVDGIMLVTPYYNKPPQDGLYKHFKLIAAETSLPVILYNVPGRTSRNIEVDTVQRLAMIDNIIAIKEASGDLEQVSTLCRTLPDDFYIYSGDDGLTLPTLSVGGQGIISVAAHLVGNEIKEMVTAFKAGKIEKAIKLNKYLGVIFSGVFINTNPIPVKAALNMIGMNVGGVRPPLVNLTADENSKLNQILQDLNLI